MHLELKQDTYEYPFIYTQTSTQTFIVTLFINPKHWGKCPLQIIG